MGNIITTANPMHPSLFSSGLRRVFAESTSAEDGPPLGSVCRSLIVRGAPMGAFAVRGRMVRSEDGLRGGALLHVMRGVCQRNGDFGCRDGLARCRGARRQGDLRRRERLGARCGLRRIGASVRRQGFVRGRIAAVLRDRLAWRFDCEWVDAV